MGRRLFTECEGYPQLLQLKEMISSKQWASLQTSGRFVENIEGTKVQFSLEWSYPVELSDTYLCGHSIKHLSLGMNPPAQIIHFLKLFRSIGLDAAALFPVGGQSKRAEIRRRGEYVAPPLIRSM